MNVPNLLTVLRFMLIPVYIAVFSTGYVRAAFMVLLLAGATDVLDGHIARTRGQVTDLGKMLDPLADKLMLLTVVISFLATGMIPWTAAIAMFIRDAGMIAGAAFFHLRGKKTVQANTMGKLTTVLYYAVILLIVFDIPYAIPALWFVVLFSFLTTGLYILTFRRINDDAEDVHSSCEEGKRAHF